MKKLIGLCFAAILAASMTACSNSGTTPTTAANGGDAAGDGSEKTFLIGGLGPLTGGAASYGMSVKQGAEIAIEEINKAGGVKVGEDTYMLKLTFADDEDSESKAITAYNSLMDQNINALLGSVTSGSCLAITEATKNDGILQITPSGSALGCTEYDNAFRLCFTDPLQGEMLADYVVDTMGYKNIAIIFNNSDEYSTGIKDVFIEKAEAKGAKVVVNESFAKNDVDFGTQLTKIKNSQAEVIIVPAYYEAASYITKQARELGLELPFVGSDGWDGILSQVTDPKAVEGAIFLSPFLSTDPAVAGFVKAYETAYKGTPDQFAADGYDTVFVMKAAMEKAGSIESAELIKAMTEIKVDGLTGSVTFDASGEPNKGAKFVEIKDGVYTAK